MENQSNIIIYTDENGQASLDVRFEQETVWLTLNQIAVLFGKDKSNISRHIKNIFKEEELAADSVVAKNATTAADGKTFLDGNKRIAASCFLYFLNENGILYKNDKKIIADETLFTLTLLIAESKPAEMETIKQIIISTLNRGAKA